MQQLMSITISPLYAVSYIAVHAVYFAEEGTNLNVNDASENWHGAE